MSWRPLEVTGLEAARRPRQSQLLHVDMQQVAGSAVLVAQRAPAHLVQAVEAVETEAPEWE